MDGRILREAAEDSPWAPIAVTKSDALGFAALVGAWRASESLAHLIVLPATASSPHDALHQALRRSGTPTAEEAARWVRQRAPSSLLADTILAELVEADSPCRQARHSRFAAAGPLRARGWKDAFRLAQALSQPSESTIDAMAGAVDRDVRTLRRLTQRLLGMPMSLARTGFGWRWALEYILRENGYLKDEEPVSLAVGLPSGRALEYAFWLGNNRNALRGQTA